MDKNRGDAKVCSPCFCVKNRPKKQNVKKKRRNYVAFVSQSRKGHFEQVLTKAKKVP